MANISILGQMRGGNSLTAACDHLVGGTTLRELRIQITAELARPAGSSIETTDDGWVNVFHEEWLLEAGENGFTR
jgi:hypothetical protein